MIFLENSLTKFEQTNLYLMNIVKYLSQRMTENVHKNFEIQDNLESKVPKYINLVSFVTENR